VGVTIHRARAKLRTLLGERQVGPDVTKDVSR